MAMDTVIIAGWAFSVKVNSSKGPSNINFDKFCDNRNFMIAVGKKTLTWKLLLNSMLLMFSKESRDVNAWLKIVISAS